MRMVFAETCIAVALCIAADFNGAAAQDKQDDAPKYSIKDVMQKAQKKGGLLDKVKSGKATDGEAKTLLDMYQSLAKQKPPAGNADSWKKKTEDLIAGAQLVVDGKKMEGVAKLQMAGNCMNCHSVHKG
jgi:hypothetical protein